MTKRPYRHRKQLEQMAAAEWRRLAKALARSIGYNPNTLTQVLAKEVLAKR